jgi:farnesyl diphosphate synthase
VGLVLADDLLGRALQRIQAEVDDAFDAFLPITA